MKWLSSPSPWSKYALGIQSACFSSLLPAFGFSVQETGVFLVFAIAMLVSFSSPHRQGALGLAFSTVLAGALVYPVPPRADRMEVLIVLAAKMLVNVYFVYSGWLNLEVSRLQQAHGD